MRNKNDKQTQGKKLLLKKQMIRELTASELEAVNGGAPHTFSDDSNDKIPSTGHTWSCPSGSH